MKKIFGKGKPKIFCVGLNKTGTTSLGSFFEHCGYKVARQREGEALLPQYLKRDFNSIINYCKDSEANVFQDIPFSLPYTFSHLDCAFPNAKFILTLRNSDIIWYQSILKFHSEIFNNRNIPTFVSLAKSKYIYKGWAWDLMHDVFISDKNDMYNEMEFLAVYNAHKTSVDRYFSHKPNKLLSINLSNEADFSKLVKFLDISTDLKTFPKITSSDIANRNYSLKFLR